MYLPEQKDNLIAVAKNTQTAYDSALSKGREEAVAEFSARVAFVDPQVIAHYASAHLTNVDNINQNPASIFRISMINADEDTLDNTKDWVNENSEARATYHALYEILSNYFEDMYEVTLDDKAGITNATSQVFLREVGLGLLWEELLPEMVRDLSEEQRSRFNSEDVSAGLAATFKSGTFDRKEGSCPFQHRVYHVCALKPERDEETGEVTIVGREKGALLAFIHNELKNGIGANNNADNELVETAENN